MGFLTNFLTEKRSLPFGLKGESPWLIADLTANPTKSGAIVTENTSLSITAIWSCIKILAWTQASLPLITYKRLVPRGKERATDHPVYDLLHSSPNSEQTAFDFRSLISVHQNLWGAGAAEIEFNRQGTPIALWPIPPWLIQIRKSKSLGGLFYEIDLGAAGKKVIPDYGMLVFPSLMSNQYEWKSPIRVHRETIGMAMALTEFGALTFGQGTNPAGIISHPTKLKEGSEKDLRESLKKYGGLGAAHRLMLLEEGMKFERIGMPAESAQYIESRKFSVSEIARMYNVPLHLLQDHEKSTSWGSGIEEMNLGFVTFTLRPYLVQAEQEIHKKLFFNDKEYFAEHLLEGLLRGKQSERFTAYSTARQWGWMSANDVREIENSNPLPGEQGNIYMIPMNMQDASKINEKPEIKEPIPEEDPEEPKEPVKTIEEPGNENNE